MTTCLVTGGAGFIGSHLVDALVTTGRRVRVLDDLSTGRVENLRSSPGVELMRGSVTDPARVAEAMHGVDRVFHLAALPSVARSVDAPLETHAACATGTLHVLDAARRMGVKRVVYAGSSSAYGAAPGDVRREDDPTLPLSPYAAAKLAGEFYCRAFAASYGLETVRLRFFNIFGPRQRADSPYSGVIPLFLAALREGRAPIIQGDGRQSRDFTYVENAVAALLRAADAPNAAGRVYNVACGASASILDLFHLLRRLLGSNLEAQFAAARAGDVRHSHADITRARVELGYEPRVSLEEGLRRLIDSAESPQGIR